jgi:two-component sensor histidine kinase/CHASE3 domain sensor protein
MMAVGVADPGNSDAPEAGNAIERTSSERGSATDEVTSIPEGGATTDRRRGWQRLIVVLSLGLVTLAVLAALVLVQGIDRQLRDITHTYDVRNKVRELTIALREAESSQRGLALTGDASYLPPYQQATASVEQRIVALSEVTAGDPAQSERVRGLFSEIQAKLGEMDATVDLTLARRDAEAQNLIETGLGTRLMAEVSTSLEAFIREEDRRLAERNANIDDSRRWLVIAIVAALAGAVLLGYTLFSRAARQVNDLTRSRSLLASENDKLEAHIGERTRAVEEARAHAERERQRVEALLQDANHRIGNSLATVSSLLGLQVIRTKSSEVRQALESARSRVHAIASSHRRLRLGSDLETASAEDFLDAVLEDIASTTGGTNNVDIVGEISPIEVSSRDATTLGILVGELVTNALKHGFPKERHGEVRVTLNRDETGTPLLRVRDNGVGLSASSSVQEETGLGSVIVKQLAQQFGGVPQYVSPPEGGLEVRVPLPGIESVPKNRSEPQR